MTISGVDSHEINVYTDGSVKNGAYGGCAWAIEDHSVKPLKRPQSRGWFGRCIALGREGDVPTTELQGIRHALEYLVERQEAGRGLGTVITIHTDCLDALNMLIHLIDTGGVDPLREDVLRVIMALLEKLKAYGIGCYFGWVRRCTTPGNVQADDWAYAGSSLAQEGKKGIMLRHGLGWDKGV
ncbi:uncharacterized protein RCC_08854 [Ramularia collo-cygni]|uniref:RNase H type-1 domain-containing protein n=1 Tax=Ramularia collo-cygni TaxID=112498 RepID=A0A2D3VL05_9PEZI|nr:uncharacterized protein RCC_08854 [Ramularia collo-cygni]CZT23144.1 uncharacterized protein RCC_08854 [Ramularia collo-cygni]